MIMKKIIALFAFAGLLTTAFSQYNVTADSSSVTGPVNFFTKGDTVADFNKLNGGITDFQVTKEATATATAHGLEIIKPGIVVVNDPAALNSNVLLEVKTFGQNGEWYINTLNIKLYDRGPLVHVSSDKIEMATAWRSNGKIYVVITVVAILFAVVLIYLFMLDRKTNALKKKLNG